MNLEKIDHLISQNNPIPTMQCQSCEGTIFRVDTWFECPDCGCKSTEFGGVFPYLSLNGESYSNPEYKKACEESLNYLSN